MSCHVLHVLSTLFILLLQLQVVVERNPDLYPPPYLYITSAWRLDKKGRRSKQMEIPGLSESPVHQNM
jgi:hypothetical protein